MPLMVHVNLHIWQPSTHEHLCHLCQHLQRGGSIFTAIPNRPPPSFLLLFWPFVGWFRDVSLIRQILFPRLSWKFVVGFDFTSLHLAECLRPDLQHPRTLGGCAQPAVSVHQCEKQIVLIIMVLLYSRVPGYKCCDAEYYVYPSYILEIQHRATL